MVKRILLLCLCLPFLTAFVKVNTLNVEDLPKTDRWYSKSLPEQRKIYKNSKDQLSKLALAQTVGDWKNCITIARGMPSKHVVRDWIWLIELTCAKKLTDNEVATKFKESRVGGKLLADTLARLDKNLKEWETSFLHDRIRNLTFSSHISLIAWLGKNSQWKEVRVVLGKVFKFEHLLTKSDRADAYMWAGELLVAERQWIEAFWQFERAKNINPDSEGANRLKTILPMVPANFRAQIEASLKSGTEDSLVPGIVASADETEIFNQAQTSLARGEVTNAVEALVKLIRKFPLGVNAKWSQEKILSLLTQEVEKGRGPQGVTVAKKKIINEISDLDSDRQWDFGRALFDMQAYEDAAVLLKQSADSISGSARAAKNYYLTARAYQLAGKYSDAKSIFKLMLKNYPLASETVDAGLQWALININEGDPSEAITHLEVARSRKMTNQQDLITLFWLYQSYKLKNAQANITQTANQLIEKFPLTYYGLIAYYDQKKQLPTFEKSKPRSGKVNFSQSEQMVLDRAKVLLSAGMLSEASEELNSINNRQFTPDEAQYLANFYVQALQYSKGFNLLGTVTEGNPDRRNLFVIKELFPKEYWDVVSDDKLRADLDPLLLLSVMRQESAFDRYVMSRSNAVGLIQMIPPTAEEVKKELGSNAQIPQDLTDPVVNVKFCAYYLAKLIKKYNGSIPTALAAYNAGPTRISLFTGSRTLTDTWVDELPWSEPSYYVKSILKNYIMYRVLYGGLTQMPSPPWAQAPATP